MAREKKKEVSNVLDAELLQQWVSSSFVKVLESQLPIAVNTVSRLRRVHPDKSPKELVGIVDKSYMGLVTGSGASAGLASVVPNGLVQGPVAVVDLAAFLEASVMYVLTVSEIYGVDIEDFERRRFLVMTALLGNSGTTTVTQALGKKTVPYWSHKIINAIPMKAITAGAGSRGRCRWECNFRLLRYTLHKAIARHCASRLDEFTYQVGRSVGR